MKTRTFAPLAALLMALCVPAAAQSYIGRVCLASTVTERETGPVTPETFTVQYEAASLGGGFYAIAGRVMTPDQPFIVTGIGTLVGSTLYINVTGTQSHSDGWRDTGVNQTRLDLATMTGTFYEIGRDFSRTTRQFDLRYTAGTLAATACP
jgi:hypothetical protein